MKGIGVGVSSAGMKASLVPGASSDILIRSSGPLILQVLMDRIQDQLDYRKRRQALARLISWLISNLLSMLDPVHAPGTSASIMNTVFLPSAPGLL